MNESALAHGSHYIQSQNTKSFFLYFELSDLYLLTMKWSDFLMKKNKNYYE